MAFPKSKITVGGRPKIGSVKQPVPKHPAPVMVRGKALNGGPVNSKPAGTMAWNSASKGVKC